MKPNVVLFGLMLSIVIGMYVGLISSSKIYSTAPVHNTFSEQLRDLSKLNALEDPAWATRSDNQW